MSVNGFCQLIAALIFSGLAAWMVFERYDTEIGSDGQDSQGYPPFYPSMLPCLLFVLILFTAPVVGLREALIKTASLSFGLFLHISVYLCLLLLILPWLRQRITARACAALWMIPNMLYITLNTAFGPDRPLWVIPVSRRLLTVLTVVWLLGFAVVMIWKTGSHLLFRHQILKDAEKEKDPAVLAVFDAQKEKTGLEKRKLRLLRSDAVRTPLSIGLFGFSTRVVLPNKPYTPEELALIFRHELIHISREDASTKFSLVFCTALCWFNPFMWIAMKKSADDLELSCDETVLLDADEETRVQYANLLLKTAGQEQGFTTCLSASASALQYRLKNTVKPRKRRSGVLAVAAATFLLFLTSGQLALAVECGTGAQEIFLDQNPEDCTLIHISDMGRDSHKNYLCLDEAALKDYLAQLPLETLTGHFELEDEDCSVVMLFETPKGNIGLDLQRDSLRVTKLWERKNGQSTFYVPGGVDWERVEAILFDMPTLQLRLEGDQVSDIVLRPDRVLQRTACSENLLREADPEAVNGILGDTDYQNAEIIFSQPPLNGFTVESADWSRSQIQQIDTDGAALPYRFDLLPEDGHYTFTASFSGPQDTVYDLTYYFDFKQE